MTGKYLRLLASTWVCSIGLILTAPAAETSSTSAQDPEEVRELAARLIEAPTDADRAAMLAEEAALVTPSLASELEQRGRAFHSRGEFDKARLSFSLMRQVAEQRHDTAGVAQALNDLGLNSRRQLRYDEALGYLQESLKLAEVTGDQKARSLSLQSMSGLYIEQCAYDKAFEAASIGLPLAEALGDKVLTARLLINLASATELQGNPNAALEYLVKASAIDVPKHELARMWVNLGDFEAVQGDNARALEHYWKTLRLLGPDGDVALTAFALEGFSRVYRSQGAYGAALDYLRRSSALYESPDTYAEIADVQADAKHYSQALELYAKAVPLYARIGSQCNVAYTLSSIGEVQLRRGKYAEATAALHAALGVSERLGEPMIRAQTYAALAEVQDKQGNFEQELLFARQAAELAEKAELHGTLLHARTLEGRAYRRLGQPVPAREALDAAIATVEELRNQVAGGEEQQWSFFPSKVAPYHEMIGLLVSQGQFSQALEYAERAKARTLVDVLVSGRTRATGAMSAQERGEEQRLQSELVSLNLQVRQEAAQADTPHFAQLRARLDKTRLAYEEFQVNLHAAHPELSIQRGQIQPVTLEEAAGLLPDAHSAFIEYVVTDERTYLFVLTRRAGDEGADVKVYPLGISAAELGRRAQGFRRQLAERDLAFRVSASALYKLLLAPARRQLADKTSLLIVPDGVLWDLPFQALLEDGHAFVLEKHAIAYAPSLTALREMVRRHARIREQAATAQSADLLAMADPVLGDSQDGGALTAALAQRGDELNALPEARREVAVLKELYGDRRSLVYTGADARESVFKAQAGRFRILHLATHGVFDDTGPMYSHLLLAPDDSGREDGLLEAWEIMQMDLKAELVVLSACETARGRISAGEGVIGLTWAFFVAGTPTTVVSQWKVEEASTASLMLAFHRALKAKEQLGSRPAFSTARALQRAAVRMLHNPPYAHPFYWASFIVIGDPN